MPVEQSVEGELQLADNGVDQSIRFSPKEAGELNLYRKPARGKRYVIGIDVCEGQDAHRGKGTSVDPDWSVADVLDVDTGEQVAQLRARLNPAIFGSLVVRLARWYNTAYLVPEANGPGLALLLQILNENYPPTQIYHRDLDPSERYSPGDKTILTRLGWKTGPVTRIQLISALDRAIRDGEVILHSQRSVNECSDFVYRPDGRVAAMDGSHDDCVISAALAVIGMPKAPDPRPVRPAALPPQYSAAAYMAPWRLAGRRR
jgi:hypothetical protein